METGQESSFKEDVQRRFLCLYFNDEKKLCKKIAIYSAALEYYKKRGLILSETGRDYILELGFIEEL